MLAQSSCFPYKWLFERAKGIQLKIETKTALIAIGAMLEVQKIAGNNESQVNREKLTKSIFHLVWLQDVNRDTSQQSVPIENSSMSKSDTVKKGTQAAYTINIFCLIELRRMKNRCEKWKSLKLNKDSNELGDVR